MRELHLDIWLSAMPLILASSLQLRADATLQNIQESAGMPNKIVLPFASLVSTDLSYPPRPIQGAADLISGP
jgi:hypothetical protein